MDVDDGEWIIPSVWAWMEGQPEADLRLRASEGERERERGREREGEKRRKWPRDGVDRLLHWAGIDGHSR